MSRTLPTVQELRDAHGEKIAYLVVGLWNTIFSYLVYAGLLGIFRPALIPMSDSDVFALAWIGGHYYLTAQWTAWVLSVPQSTLAFRQLVFHTSGSIAGQVGRAFLVYVPLQLLSSGLLWLFSGLLRWPPLLGQLPTIAVATVLSYVLHKQFTFRAAVPDGRP